MSITAAARACPRPLIDLCMAVTATGSIVRIRLDGLVPKLQATFEDLQRYVRHHEACLRQAIQRRDRAQETLASVLKQCAPGDGSQQQQQPVLQPPRPAQQSLWSMWRTLGSMLPVAGECEESSRPTEPIVDAIAVNFDDYAEDGATCAWTRQGHDGVIALCCAPATDGAAYCDTHRSAVCPRTRRGKRKRKDDDDDASYED